MLWPADENLQLRENIAYSGSLKGGKQKLNPRRVEVNQDVLLAKFARLAKVWVLLPYCTA